MLLWHAKCARICEDPGAYFLQSGGITSLAWMSIVFESRQTIDTTLVIDVLLLGACHSLAIFPYGTDRSSELVPMRRAPQHRRAVLDALAVTIPQPAFGHHQRSH